MNDIRLVNPSGIPVTLSAKTGVAVTPSDTLTFDLAQLFVGVGGDVAVKFASEATTVVFKGIGAGSFLPINVVQVLATGTTATDIVALR